MAKDHARPYPNPAQDRFALSIEPKDLDAVHLIDATGRVVRSWAMTNEFLLAGLKSGAYVVQASFNDGSERRWPLVVQ